MVTRGIPALTVSVPLSHWRLPLVARVTPWRGCSSIPRQVHRYKPHCLGVVEKVDTNIPHAASQAESTSQLRQSSPFSSSSRQLTLDSFAPPSTLTVEVAVEYMASLRGLHQSLGISSVASQVRWQARDFLLRGMPHASRKRGVEESWEVTERFACAIVVTCANFEVSLFQCLYGRESVEFLHGLWKRRLLSSSSSSFSHKCEEAVVLGRLCLAVLEQVANGAVYAATEKNAFLTQLLCEALLPSVMRFLQDDTLLAPHNNNNNNDGGGGDDNDDGGMTAEQAMAFSLLISSLTKATVTHWARGGTSPEAGNVVFFGMPTCQEQQKQKQKQSDACGQQHVPCFSAAHTTVAPLSLKVLSRVMQRYVRSLLLPQVRKTALPMLRFFTLSQCIPQLAQPPNNENDLKELTVSLATSVTTLLQVTLDSNVTSISHRVANIASIYARVLSFRPAEMMDMDSAHDKAIFALPSWRVFESIMKQLQHNILHGTEALCPSNVMLQLCERVTPFARKYLFSDLAALLNALTKIFRVVCDHHAGKQEQHRVAAFPTGNVGGSAADAPLCADIAACTRSRFERRRNVLSVPKHHQMTSMMTSPEVHQVSSVQPHSHTESEPVSVSSPPSRSPKSWTFVVSSDDIAEIESELEVLLDACVAVMERHMPSLCTGQQVYVPQHGLSSPTVSTDDSKGVSSTWANDEESVSLARVARSHAKALGGKSRLLKKSIASKELIMIAESVHALSWRPFVAFQARLLLVLSSEVGQIDLNASQYAYLVRLVLRAPPALPSVVFHTVGDRLKRLIHSEAITVASETEKGNTVVIASALACSLQDQPLPLWDACIVVFAFAQKMKGNALPLLNDILARCGQLVLRDCNSVEACNATAAAALAMFVASATWVISNSQATASESHVIAFIVASRDHAARVLAEAADSVTLFSLSIREFAYACMMLESCNTHGNVHIAQLHNRLREAYVAHAARFDSLEVAQFAADFLAIIPSQGAGGNDDCGASLQMPSWMIAPLQLRERCECGRRLLSGMFIPFFHGGGDDDNHIIINNERVSNGSGMDDVTRTLEVARQHCRTFATLVAMLRLLRIADAALLADDAVREVVLRKVTQLTRRTARPLDLFFFFEMYGDCPEIVSLCLGELVPEARCFSTYEANAFVPIVEVNAALRAVRRLRVRALRQQWLAKMSSLIVCAVSFSREPLDVVIDLAELIGTDDPELLQAVLKSSASMHAIHKTFSFTAPGSTVLRLLLLLQGGNGSHPVVRRLRMASAKLIQGGKVNVPLEQLAQAMLLPSLEDTTLGRRLQRLFIFRVGKLLGTLRQSPSRLAADAVKESGDGERRVAERFHRNQWDESLDRLELEHWLTLLSFSHVGKPSSHRLLMSMKQDAEDAMRRKGGPKLVAAQVTEMASSADHLGDAALQLEEGRDETADAEVATADVLNGPRYRGLAVVYAFSEGTIMCLRQSLGASRFIAFVSELLRFTSRVWPHTSLLPHQISLQSRWMYDGSASPLSDERILPFVRLASHLVEEMSVDLADFLRRERQRNHEEREPTKEQKRRSGGELIATDEEIELDIGAILGYLQALDVYDPLRREQLLLLPPSHDRTMCLPQLHLHRILLQVPRHLDKGTVAGDGVVRIRLRNISAVFDYCTIPTKGNLPLGVFDTSTEMCCRLKEIFGAEQPLLCDVWMPLRTVQSRQMDMEKDVRALLFDALMQCLIREGESSAATRTRLAVLGQRDLVCVVRVCVCHEDSHGGFDDDAAAEKLRCSSSSSSAGGRTRTMRRSMRVEAVSAIELLTDMLPSTGAQDLYDVVLALLPLLQPKDHQKLSRLATSKDGHHDGDREEEREIVVAGVRRLLAHVAVVMGNDTERFPLPLLFGILQHLHTPHRLVSLAAAEMMLKSLHATDGNAGHHPQQLEQWQQEEDDVDAGSNAVDRLASDVSSTTASRGHYAATLALLRSIIAGASIVDMEMRKEEGFKY